MIYTLTLNPAIDYVMEADALTWGGTNRARRTAMYFGGKGINVSTVLARLGAETTALALTAGFTGAALEEAVGKRGFPAEFFRLPGGETRVNVKLKGETETELNAPGPAVAPADLELLYARLDRLEPGDTLVLAGSVPPTLPEDIYAAILTRLSGRDIRAVVDAAGSLLENALACRPFLVKPNRAELEALCRRPMDTDEAVAQGARELLSRGAENVLVSLGPDGALLLDSGGAVHRRRAVPGRTVNTVGAGDSMVAGFLAGLERGWEAALTLAVAAGCATAFSPDLARREDILALCRALPPEG